jgi:hypothetical protein
LECQVTEAERLVGRAWRDELEITQFRVERNGFGV